MYLYEIGFFGQIMALIVLTILKQTISGKILKENTNIISPKLAYIVKIFLFYIINPQVTKAHSTQLGTSENIRLLSTNKKLDASQRSD